MQLLLTAAGAVAVLLVLAAALARAALSVIVVAGWSMAPTLRPGQRVLVLSRRFARLRPGRIVVVSREALGLPADPSAPADRPGPRRHRLLVKRLAALPGDPVPEPVRAAVPATAVPGGQVVLIGDNPAFSTDSRLWGAVPAHSVVGVVLEGVRLPARPAPRRG
ncbi:S26 family signal peptidase [Kitasatospora sp. NPDC058170]|uniref:S26 family signal peptidase n=1 Tax=Kitasatospora sp. NPDC058170 TaxID=3346364 RepID=UPI0036D857FB